MSAGLQSVPDELLEAARIDGAGPWTRFWRMTVPLLSPTIFFAGVVSTIYAFQAFGAVDILIGNQNTVRLHTNVLIYNIINTLQIENNTGAAAIMAIVLFLILLGLTLLQMRFLERRVTYAQLTCSRTPRPWRSPRLADAAPRRPRRGLAHHRQLHPADGGRRRRPVPDLRDDRELAPRPRTSWSTSRPRSSRPTRSGTTTARRGTPGRCRST